MHLQATVPGWTTVIEHLPERAFIKAFDASILREAKLVWAALGRDPEKLFTVLRYHDFAYQFWSDPAFMEMHWEANFRRFVDGTYLREYAQYVDAVEEYNEYSDSRTDPRLMALWLTSAAAAQKVWNTIFRGQEVHTADGGVGRIPANCRLVMFNVPVGNDIHPEQVALAIAGDSINGYHNYAESRNGQRVLGEWEFCSGRWVKSDQPGALWAFTEGGPFAGADEGWRHSSCLGGNIDKLIEVTRATAYDTTQTDAYRQGRILGGPTALFTTGYIGWPYYQVDVPELIRWADAIRTLWVAPAPAPRARVQDVSGLYQDPAQMHYAEWRALGFALGFYEVAIGTRLIRWAQEHHDAMRAAGYITGPYLALHESDDPVTQADLLIGQRRVDDDGPDMLDFERDGLTEAMLAAFCDRHDARSRWPLWIYTRFGFWLAHVPSARRARYARYGLYLAAWPYDTPAGQPVPMDPVSVALRSNPPSLQPLVPAPWLLADAQQHTGQGSLPGYPRFLDLGVYGGTEAQLRARFPRLEPEMPNVTVDDLTTIAEAAAAQLAIARKYLEPPAPVPLYRVRIIVDALNVRSGPAATFADIGDVTRDQVLDVWEAAPSGWLRIHQSEQRWISGSSSYSTRV